MALIYSQSRDTILAHVPGATNLLRIHLQARWLTGSSSRVMVIFLQ